MHIYKKNFLINFYFIFIVPNLDWPKWSICRCLSEAVHDVCNEGLSMKSSSRQHFERPAQFLSTAKLNYVLHRYNNLIRRRTKVSSSMSAKETPRQVSLWCYKLLIKTGNKKLTKKLGTETLIDEYCNGQFHL